MNRTRKRIAGLAAAALVVVAGVAVAVPALAGHGPGSGDGPGSGGAWGSGEAHHPAPVERPTERDRLGPGYGPGPRDGSCWWDQDAPAGELAGEQAATMVAVTEQAKLAHDLYAAFADQSDLRVFDRLAVASARQLVALRELLDRYGIADPTSDLPDGQFADRPRRRPTTGCSPRFGERTGGPARRRDRSARPGRHARASPRPGRRGRPDHGLPAPARRRTAARARPGAVIGQSLAPRRRRTRRRRGHAIHPAARSPPTRLTAGSSLCRRP